MSNVVSTELARVEAAVAEAGGPFCRDLGLISQLTALQDQAAGRTALPMKVPGAKSPAHELEIVQGLVDRDGGGFSRNKPLVDTLRALQEREGAKALAHREWLGDEAPKGCI